MATTLTRAPLAAYNQRAAEYAQDIRAFQHWRDELVRAMPLRPGDTVVDVGCGSGLCLAGIPGDRPREGFRAASRMTVDLSPGPVNHPSSRPVT